MTLLLKMAAIGKSLLSNFLEELCGQIFFLVFLNRRVTKFNLAANDVMETNHEHVLNLVYILLLEVH